VGESDAEAAEVSFRARIEQRFRINSALIVAARVVTASLSLATIPVVVSRVGVAGYGTWEALLAVAGLAPLIQTAIGGTLVWRISDAYGRNDAAEIRRLVRLGAAASLWLFAVLWPLAWFLREPLVEFLRVPSETRQTAALMFPLIAALVLVGGLSDTLDSVVSGCQRTGFVNVVAAIAHGLNYSVVIVVILLGGGLWSLVIGQAVGAAGRLAGSWVATRLSFGAVSLLPILPSRADLSTARYSGLLAVGAGATVLRDQTDKVILATLASPAWVGYYAMAARLSGVVMEIIRFFYLPILTAVGALNAAGDWDGIRRLYSRVMAAVSIVTGLVVVLVAGLADRMVVLWIGRPIPEVTLLLWLLMAGSASAATLTGPGTAICRGAGRAGIETAYLALNLVLNLGLTVILVLLIGPIGTAVATGSTWAVSSIVFLYVLHGRLDLPAVASRRSAARMVVAATVAAAVYAASSLVSLPEGRQEALQSIALLGAASATIYFGLLAAFRLMPVSEVYGDLRARLRRAG
jgi:O-antigen/teichoic acid export membrane protein